MFEMKKWNRQAQAIGKILADAPAIDKNLRATKGEFERRRKIVYKKLREAGFDAGFVYSDEHYCGDVPYLGGNTNITIEPVAGLIGANGFHLLAGLEGGYVAEQLALDLGTFVHKLEMLKLADEEYPVEAERLSDVIEECCGKKIEKIALLTPREILPVAMRDSLAEYFGDPSAIIDMQELYYKVKYEKSDEEMALLSQAGKICDVMIKGMLGILTPGLLETQLAGWGYAIASELGVEDMGFDIIVNANDAGRTLIGKALNRPIMEGDVVSLGVAPKCAGLTACERCSVVAVKKESLLTEDQRFWLSFVQGAYRAGYDAYAKVAAEGLPAKTQEQALVVYFKSREKEVCEKIGKNIDLTRQKPYTGTHNAGYTECQEFYGAITLNSEEPLGGQIVTMLDVAIRGAGSKWNEIVIPGVDYYVVEKTLGKYKSEVRTLTELPVDLQVFVGSAL
ncbi:MAG: hypothetical protein FWF03_02845 [Defluviitaleaceae bacterium]|nr:hypothetical protein [Defluviitaleaceae bacterium]